MKHLLIRNLTDEQLGMFAELAGLATLDAEQAQHTFDTIADGQLDLLVVAELDLDYDDGRDTAA